MCQITRTKNSGVFALSKFIITLSHIWGDYCFVLFIFFVYLFFSYFAYYYFYILRFVFCFCISFCFCLFLFLFMVLFCTDSNLSDHSCNYEHVNNSETGGRRHGPAVRTGLNCEHEQVTTIYNKHIIKQPTMHTGNYFALLSYGKQELLILVEHLNSPLFFCGSILFIFLFCCWFVYLYYVSCVQCCFFSLDFNS